MRRRTRYNNKTEIETKIKSLQQSVKLTINSLGEKDSALKAKLQNKIKRK